jgi:small subunit ribosomal protein S15
MPVVCDLMARMHSRKKGKSGSKHPISKKAPEFVKYSKEEITDLVVKLAKEGKSTSHIGLVLRDQFGIPSVKSIVGKSISQIFKENKLYGEWPEDIMNLIKKAVKLRKHLDANKTDIHNRRVLRLVESKIRRLAKYYKRNGIIAQNWYYKPEVAALLIRE